MGLWHSFSSRNITRIWTCMLSHSFWAYLLCWKKTEATRPDSCRNSSRRHCAGHPACIMGKEVFVVMFSFGSVRFSNLCTFMRCERFLFTHRHIKNVLLRYKTKTFSAIFLYPSQRAAFYSTDPENTCEPTRPASLIDEIFPHWNA